MTFSTTIKHIGFFFLLFFLWSTTASAADWRLFTPLDELSTPDTIGIGYREQIGERSGEFAAKKRLTALAGTLDLALQTELLNRTVTGFEPHYKQDVKFKVNYRESSPSPFTFGWVMDGEAFRDQQMAQVLQLGRAGALANGYALTANDQYNGSSEIVQRRGRALVGEQYQGHRGAVAVHGGLAYDEDLRSIGWGPAMQIELRSDSMMSADWEMIGDAGYRHAWLRPREDAKGNANLSLFRRYDEATVTVNATLERALRDIVGTPQFRRDEWHGQGAAQLRFPAPGSGDWRIDGEWDGSKVRQGDVLPSSSQLRQEYQLEWSGARRDRFLTADYRLGFQTSRSGVQLQKDQSENIKLTAGLTSALDDTLQLVVDGTATRTDTPDTLDNNDRDELRWHIQMNAVYRLLPGLWVSGDLSTVMLHNQYLSRSTSSSNRHTNTYTIGGTMTQLFQTGNHRFRAEAVVTYVLFDFPIATQPNRDVLSRRLSFYDSATARMGVGALQWNLRTDFEDRGSFNRSAYEQSLSEAIRTIIGTIRYRIPLSGVGVGLGVTAYERQPYRYELRTTGNQRIAETAVAGIGPSLTLDRSPGNGWRLYGEATLLVVSRSPRGSYMQNDVSLMLSRVW